VCLLCLAGCASAPPATATSGQIDPDQVLAGQPIIGDEPMQAPAVDGSFILAVTDDMRQFIDEFVDGKNNRYLRLHQLLRAIINDGSFGLEYGPNTDTAAGTFSTRTGNCLSFTNMFIAMAREVGIDARYQEVDIPPDWSMRGDTYLLNRHVNVYVRLSAESERVVDFNIDDFRATYNRRRITDERAFAHYFSNKGVENLQAGNNVEAFVMFRSALTLDRTFSPAWSNLAALYNRIDEPVYAEAAYLEALRLQPREFVSMSNLSRLHAAQGNDELAEYYENQVRYHRTRNPYYRYHLARQAFLERDYETSIKHLKYAVNRKQWEDSFYFLMGLNYLQLGDEVKARRWMEKAEEVAESNSLKRNYQSKIDLLLSAEQEPGSEFTQP